MADREQAALEQTSEQPPMTGRATMAPTGDANLRGEVTFTHHDEGVRIRAHIEGVGADSVYTLYLHEEGDCSAPDAQSAGAPYAPGSDMPASENDRPVGRIGTLALASDNVGQYERLDGAIDLDGPDAIIGRAVVLYGGPGADNEQPGPASGTALACGVIELDDPVGLPAPDAEEPDHTPDPGEQPEPQTQPDPDLPME